MNQPPRRYSILLATGLNVGPLIDAIPNGTWQQASDFDGEDDFPLKRMRVSDRSGQRHAKFATREDGLAFADLCLALVAPVIGEILEANVQINRLLPGQRVMPHVDPPVMDGRRFNLVLQASPGSTFHIGDETIEHRSGDLWELKEFTRTRHWATNDSDSERLVVIIDPAPPRVTPPEVVNHFRDREQRIAALTGAARWAPTS